LLTGESPPRQSPTGVDPIDLEACAKLATPLAIDDLARGIVPRIEAEIAAAVDRDVDDAWMRGAIGYQFGWTDADFATLPPDQRRATGKRLRPLLAILCYLSAADARDLGSFGSTAPNDAVTFAAAVELVHNFSLIHDDIEDRDRSRRGRPTLWTVCGEGQAINAGDCVQALAYACLGRLHGRGVDQGLVGQLVYSLAKATADMTIGQRRDMSYEASTQVDTEMYSLMIAGKTAALMSCATYGGALLALGGAGPIVARRAAGYGDFGRELGLCFQVRDDILGIWGVEAETGKSTGNDIRRRKKSLPVVLAMDSATGASRDRLADLYSLETELTADQERDVRDVLGECQAHERTQAQAELHAGRALTALADASAGLDDNPFLATLRFLTGSLTARSS
jgi:geranylgeranyl diphosphate synthase type I